MGPPVERGRRSLRRGERHGRGGWRRGGSPISSIRRWHVAAGSHAISIDARSLGGGRQCTDGGYRYDETNLPFGITATGCSCAGDHLAPETVRIGLYLGDAG